MIRPLCSAKGDRCQDRLNGKDEYFFAIGSTDDRLERSSIMLQGQSPSLPGNPWELLRVTRAPMNQDANRGDELVPAIATRGERSDRTFGTSNNPKEVPRLR